jgi:hypothetical protein
VSGDYQLIEKILFTTSFNQELYEKYAFRLVRSFEELLPEASLTVIWEGAPCRKLQNAHHSINFVPESESFSWFFKRFGRLSEAHGWRLKKLGGSNNSESVELVQNYRWDAIRFCHKVFALDLVVRSLPQTHQDFLVWLDADVVIKKRFVLSDLRPCLPNSDEVMCYLGRDHKYSETGFLAFNLRHPTTFDYLSRMAQFYDTGLVFSLDEWHDSYVWDHVRREFESRGASFRNISGRGSQTGHPFVNSLLGGFLDHCKGDLRKQLGHSLPQDYFTGAR